MLFIFDDKEPISINMFKMKYALDVIFMDKDWKVIDNHRMHPGKNVTTHSNVKYVVEVNAGELTSVLPGTDIEPEESLLKFTEEKEEEIEVVELPKAEKSEDKEDEKEVEEKNLLLKLDKKEVEKHEIFKVGGKIKPKEADIAMDSSAMQVLDDKGIILMNITGGERIFSRDHTKQLVTLAKEIDEGEADPEDLGKLITEFINLQDTQQPEYVYE